MAAQKYRVEQNLKDSVNLLPFPDPHLTLGDVSLIAKGPSKAHRKLREQLKQITEG